MGKTIVVFLYTTQKQTKPNRPIHSTRTSHVLNHPIKKQTSKQRTTRVGESARAKLAKIQKKLSQWITVVPQRHETSKCCCWLQVLSSKAVTMLLVTVQVAITLRWRKGAGNA